MTSANERAGRHLLEYWKVLQRRRFIVYLAAGAVTMVALLGSFLVTPLYRATTTLLIERQNPEIFTFRDVASVDSSWSAYADFYQTQYRILSSEAVARKAVARLGLTSHPDFQPGSRKPGLYARLRGLFPSRGVRVAQSPEDVAAARLLGSLAVSPVRNSHLVQISWISPDPRIAAKVANAVAEAYIQFTIEAQFTTSDQATEFLADQIAFVDIPRVLEEVMARHSLQAAASLDILLEADRWARATARQLTERPRAAAV